MAGDPFAAVKDLDCRGGDARLDLLAEQLVRHAVVVFADLDMVVEADPAALPLGVFVGQRRQRSERRFVKLLEKRPPARAPAAHRTVIELVEQGADRGVELGEREKAAMPQPCQDPAPNDLDANLDFSFIPHCRLLIVRVRPAAGSASPTLSIRSQGGSSIWSVAAVTRARTGSPISTTTVGYARSLPI